MLAPELMTEIRIALARIPTVRELPEREAADLLTSLGTYHVAKPDEAWWWSNLKDEREVIPYGDDDGLQQMARILPRETAVFLAITDDEAPPWPVLSGKVADLLAVLRELSFCEYFLFDIDGTWIAFDTHHDELVIAGTLVAEVRQVK
jgi:hypothetical protein